MDIKLKKDKGVTLIELLIALVISGILIAALYRGFISQQKTYTVQEQVADMQQNVRVAINKMMREMRMAGFGNVRDVLSLPGGVNGFTNVITPNENQVTVVGGFRQISTLASNAIGGQNNITLANATEASNFDGAVHRYISIGGLESNTVQARAGAVLTLDQPLRVTHPVGTPTFKIHAITYGIRNDDGVLVLFRDLYSNTGSSRRETVSENIENLRLQYFDANGNLLGLPIADPGIIRMIRVAVTARTRMADPEFKGGDGFRRRIVTSNIQLRNIGL
jgi:prepilin-type N-terminal cleavage/methylation domain-containing protein